MITIWVPKRLVEIDLLNVAARSGPQLVQVCEDSYARRLGSMPPKKCASRGPRSSC